MRASKARAAGRGANPARAAGQEQTRAGIVAPSSKSANRAARRAAKRARRAAKGAEACASESAPPSCYGCGDPEIDLVVAMLPPQPGRAYLLRLCPSCACELTSPHTRDAAQRALQVRLERVTATGPVDGGLYVLQLPVGGER